VYLEGQLQTRKWQNKDGQDQYTTEVVLQRFRGELVMLDGKGGEGALEGASMGGGGGRKAVGGGRSNDNDFSASGDDEIPF
jgi:single-strand DNA-binding protein